MERRQVYMTFLGKDADCLDHLDFDRIPREEPGRRYREVMRHAYVALQEVNLIASSSVRKAGTRLVDALAFALMLRWSHGLPVSRGDSLSHDDQQDALVWAVQSKVRAFEDAARVELGVRE